MSRVLSILDNLGLGISLLAVLGVLLGPSLFGLTFHTILGGSMTPTLRAGGVIGLRVVQPEEVRVGDIVGFRVRGMDTPVCHRVVEILEAEEGIGFRTKGDAQEDSDRWIVGPEDLLGRVILHLPWLGYVTGFVRTRHGFGLLMVLPAVMIVGLQVRELLAPEQALARRVKEFRKRDRSAAYLCLFVGLVMIGCLWGMMSGNTQHKVLGSFAWPSQGPHESTYVSQRRISNDSPLPLIICLSSEHPEVALSEEHFRLSPGEQRTIEIRGDSADGVITTGCFFPLLPEGLLYRLFAWNSLLAPLIAASIPIFPLVIGAFALLGGFSSSRRDRRAIARPVRRRLVQV